MDGFRKEIRQNKTALPLEVTIHGQAGQLGTFRFFGPHKSKVPCSDYHHPCPLGICERRIRTNDQVETNQCSPNIVNIKDEDGGAVWLNKDYIVSIHNRDLDLNSSKSEPIVVYVIGNMMKTGTATTWYTGDHVGKYTLKDFRTNADVNRMTIQDRIWDKRLDIVKVCQSVEDKAKERGTAKRAKNGTAKRAKNGKAGNGTAKRAGHGTAKRAGNGKAKRAGNGTAKRAKNGTAKAGADGEFIKRLRNRVEFIPDDVGKPGEHHAFFEKYEKLNNDLTSLKDLKKASNALNAEYLGPEGLDNFPFGFDSIDSTVTNDQKDRKQRALQNAQRFQVNDSITSYGEPYTITAIKFNDDDELDFELRGNGGFTRDATMYEALGFRKEFVVPEGLLQDLDKVTDEDFLRDDLVTYEDWKDLFNNTPTAPTAPTASSDAVVTETVEDPLEIYADAEEARARVIVQRRKINKQKEEIYGNDQDDLLRLRLLKERLDYLEKKEKTTSEKADAINAHTTIALRDKRTHAKKERDRANDRISEYTRKIEKSKKTADNAYAKYHDQRLGEQAVQTYSDKRDTEELLRDYWDEKIDRLSAMS